jgi:lipopolysaccharide export system permease protein
VLQESILPFFLGFGLITFIFYMDFLFDLLNLLLAKGVPGLVVLELFLLALGWIVVLAVPCGVLMASLMTFGRMAQDNEVTAMRSLGANVARIMRAPVIGALLLSGVMVLFSNFVLPETNHRFAGLMNAINRKRPTARIEPGIFINAFDNYSLLIKQVNDKTGELFDVTIYDYSSGAVPTTILAQRGHMEYINEGRILKLELWDGEIHVVPGTAADGKYRRGSFLNHTLLLENPGAVMERSTRTGRSDREMNVAMMREEIAKLDEQRQRRLEALEAKARAGGYASYADYAERVDPPRGIAWVTAAVGRLLGREAPPDTARVDPGVTRTLSVDRSELEGLNRRIDAYRVEIQKKFSIPFACVVFVLLGAPLGVRTRLGGFANMALAVVFSLLYWLFLIGGEQLADRRIVSPFFSMWLPNFFFGALGIYLTASVVGLGPSRGMR